MHKVHKKLIKEIDPKILPNMLYIMDSCVEVTFDTGLVVKLSYKKGATVRELIEDNILHYRRN